MSFARTPKMSRAVRTPLSRVGPKSWPPKSGYETAPSVPNTPTEDLRGLRRRRVIFTWDRADALYAMTTLTAAASSRIRLGASSHPAPVNPRVLG